MRRALIIDDSPATRRFLERTLTELGFEVTGEESAEHGAASALSSPPSLIVSDMRMPGLSGLQLCRLLREDPRTAHVPIILMTATLDKRTRYWALQSGATALITKQEAAALPKLIELLPIARAPKESKAEVVLPATIPTRLSHLLDKSLYQSVLAKELRSLALASDTHELFQKLTQLLCKVSDYEWLGLSTIQGPTPRACAHVHCERTTYSTEEAAQALELKALGLKSEELATLADVHCTIANSQALIEVFPISIAGLKLGRLAVKATPNSNDKGFFAFVASELAPALRSVILTEETRRLALTDALTGLWNRRSASENLVQCSAAAHRYQSQLSVAMLDVDYFKRINDNHGHHSGDLALQHVAKLVQSAARKADITARWGGEEFLVIMPSTGAPGARVAAERVRMSLADSPVTLEDGTALRVTVSLGIATLKAGESHGDLVNRADQALYLAKDRGRNRVEQG